MDMAVGAYQQLGPTILKYTVVPTLISFAAMAFITGYVIPSMGVTKDASNVRVQAGEFLSLLALALFVGVPLFLMGLSYISAFVTGMVSDYMVGAVPDPNANAQRARQMIPKMLAITGWEILWALGPLIVSGLLFLASAMFGSNDDAPFAVASVAAVAFFVGIITFPIVVCRQILAVPVGFIEGSKVLKCSKRSVMLMRGSVHHTSGYATVVSLALTCFTLIAFLWIGISAGLEMLGTAPWLESLTAGNMAHDLLEQASEFIPLFLTLWFVLPVWSATATILYYERRTRLEGLDIESLAQDVYRHAKTNRFEL